MNEYEERPATEGQPESVFDAIDDDELLTVVRENVRTAELFFETEISRQREKAYQYYYGLPLGNEIDNRSKHVSREVFKVVESVKPILLETFSATKRIAKFDPVGPEDLQLADQATAYVNHVFYQQNNGMCVLDSLFHDALIAKNGIIKRYWKHDFEYIKESFNELPEEQFIGLANQPDVELLDVEEGQAEAPPEVQQQAQQQQMAQLEQQIMAMPEFQRAQAVKQIQQNGPPQMQPVMIKVYSGEIRRRIDTSKVCLEVVPPENFLIDERSATIDKANFVSQRTRKRAHDLIKEGYDPDLVAQIGSNDTDAYSNEEYARHGIDDSYRFYQSEVDSTDRRELWVYESYIKIDREGDGIATLHKCIHSGNVMLDTEEVLEAPFNSWTPYPLSHKFWGMSIYDVVHHIQKSQSSLTRGILDNMYLTNNSRYLADLSLVRNPKDLLANRIGGVVNVSDVSRAVVPMPSTPLSQGIFQAGQLLDDEKQELSGVSKVSTGLDARAMATNTASSLVELMSNNSNRRIMKMARHFAETCLKPLMLAIYRLVIEYEREEKMLAVGGQYQPIMPSQWITRTDVSVSTALTPEEQTLEAQKLMMMDATIKQDPEMAPLYSIKEKYAVWSKIMELTGITNANSYLGNPLDPEVQQRIQQQQQLAQQEIQYQKQMQAQITAQKMATEQQKVDIAANKVASDIMVKRQELDQEALTDSQRIQLDREKQAHQEYIDEQELQIERSQGRPAEIG